MPDSAAEVFDRLAATEPPTRTRKLFGTAVVLGGSVAGLLAARVLTDHAERVVVVERDEPDGATSRRGVPQSAQVHTLLPGGRRQLDRWFDGFAEEAVAEGAMVARPGNFKAYFNGVEKVEDPTFELIIASRPFLESIIRRRVVALPDVAVVRGRATAVDIADGRAIGVRYVGEDGAEAVLAADFVVDAMGRSSRLGDWLEAAGWGKPHMERMPIDINYTTAYFRRAERVPEVVAGISFWAEPKRPAGVAPAALNAIEGDRWMIMLGGYGDDRPGATPEEFLRMCGRLPEIFGNAAAGEMLGDVHQYKQADSRRRAYHALERFPARLVSVGDAVASFNPIYGQGMSSAALHASCLSEWLRSDPVPDAPAKGFFALQKVVVDSAWQTSATPDLALPHISGPYPRGYRAAQWVTDQIVEASVTDVEVAKRFNAVTFMTAHPTSLISPSTVLRALRTNLRNRRRGGLSQ